MVVPVYVEFIDQDHKLKYKVGGGKCSFFG